MRVGRKFKGNINNAVMEIIAIENGVVFFRDCKTGKMFQYGIEAFKRCDITMLDEAEWSDTE